MMVAWHEMPGKMRSGIRPVGDGVICVSTGVDFFMRRGLRKFGDQGVPDQATIIESLRDKAITIRRFVATNGLLDSPPDSWWTETGFLIEAHPWIMEDRENRSQ
jgi:hypothetical protein